MRGRGWRCGALVACLLVTGCSLFREPSPPPIVDGVQEGIASWYGPGFHGNRTANGEIYDQYELTAAHPSLPHGTRVMVTNLTNGRAIEVRINDRGPFVGGRAIDLSYAAAQAIHMVGPGTARVRIEVLGQGPRRRTPPPRYEAPAEPVIVARREPAAPVVVAERAPEPALLPPAPNDLPTAMFSVEVASLTDPARADHLRGVLARRFPDAFVAPLRGAAGNYYRVRLGPYPLRSAALARAERVSRLGYPAIIMEEATP
jgi:rare lipoprotein A